MQQVFATKGMSVFLEALPRHLRKLVMTQTMDFADEMLTCQHSVKG